jgi:hypothetical protein
MRINSQVDNINGQLTGVEQNIPILKRNKKSNKTILTPIIVIIFVLTTWLISDIYIKMK